MKQKWCRIWSLGTSIGVSVFTLMALAAQLTPGEEALQFRNSLIAEPALGPADFEWSAGNVPEGFLWETKQPPQEFVKIAQNILGNQRKDLSNLEKAKLVAAHLRQKPSKGGRIGKSSLDTYKEIVATGNGYCADYSEVFLAIGLAANIPVREWGFGLTGFGAGHAFNEVFDETTGKWVVIDSFYGFYAIEVSAEEPLSALELRQRLRDKPNSVEFVALSGAAVSKVRLNRARAFYGQGLEQFYLWWGNNIFTYEDNAVASVLAGISESAAQGYAIASGIFPRIKMVADGGAERYIRVLEAKNRTVLGLTGGLLMAVGMIFVVVMCRESGNRKRGDGGGRG